MKMIKTVGLRKSFHVGKDRKRSTVEAVRGIDLAVTERETFGFPGPNGTGKTTILRMLATLIVPEYGDRKCKTYSGGQRRRLNIALGAWSS